MSKPIRAALSLSLVLVACTPRGTAEAPDGGGGPGTGDHAAGVQLRYALAPGKLVQTATFDMSTTGGGQFGQAALQFTANLVLAPQGDRLKVGWSFAEIGALELQGMFAAQEAGGGDAKALLVAEGKGAFLVDARGQLDEDASNGLAENVARRKRFDQLATQAAGGAPVKLGGGVQLLAFADAMIVLPDLPEQDLEVGKPITVSAEEQTELGASGMVLPTETETKYTLVKIDASGGKRIAELQVAGVSRGAADTEGGKVTVEIISDGTMLFDLDAKLPVSYRFTRSQSISLGQTDFESTMMLEASFAGA